MDLNTSFWDWFRNKSEDIYNYKKNQSDIFKQLSHELKKIHSDLTFLIGPINNNRRKFIVSANGMFQVFPIVQELVNIAPKFERWEIIALKPRIGATSPIKMHNFTLVPEDVFFDYKYNKSTQKINIKIFIKDYDGIDKRYKRAAFHLLDNALGEYHVATKIGSIEFQTLVESKNLKRFSLLPDIVDRF